MTASNRPPATDSTAVATAVPDPAVIARLANAFFAALPGQPVPAAGTADWAVPDLPASLLPSPPPVTVPTPATGIPAGASPAGQFTTPDPGSLLTGLGDLIALVPRGYERAGPAAAETGLYFLAQTGAGRPLAPAQAPTADSSAEAGRESRSSALNLEGVGSGLTPSLVPTLGSSARPFNAATLRRDFPILNRKVNGKPLVWLDSAATTQKPQAVIDRISHFYEHENSNIHRGAHALAARATDAYEAARAKVARFLGAGSSREIVFVRGATEGINLIAQAWGRRHVGPDDEIVITWLEHHANIVPWQQLAAETGARLRVAPVDDRGQILLDQYERLFTPRTRLAAITHVSNALGTVTPVHEMIAIAHRHGARVLVDGAQAVSHMPVDVQALDSDFYVFSGHKVFGPTGIGVVHGKEELLNAMPPWQGGGNMIVDVTFEKTIYQPAPGRFEAGTGNIADAVGLGAAIDYLDRIGMAAIARAEHDLLTYATDRLLTIPGLTLIGTAHEKAGVLSFILDGFRSEDVGAALSEDGIAVRAGHHCAQPILRRFGLESTVRPSLALYNTCEDIDALIAALLRLQHRRGIGSQGFPS